ncbi:hypothetical protein BDV40DRAFT_263556 [Aspergillus tamarii]|uniref:Uncharacterized protein n=1 Tax=Aspergillus tamarii TaxID=41984 RepID=A0A5N6UX26_ASPTM|nr:hypothetical protein BDV40DRAFT_263556 [Aspergillus tamarii]
MSHCSFHSISHNDHTCLSGLGLCRHVDIANNDTIMSDLRQSSSTLGSQLHFWLLL